LERSDPAVPESLGPVGDRAFAATSALLFVVSAAVTIRWCGSMSGGMRMPGGWTMSMTWMPMSGQNGLRAAASFIAMWTVMMVAMMLPSLMPMLSGYRRSIAGSGRSHLGLRTTLAGAGYFLVWALLGAVAYPIGLALSTAEMRSTALAAAVPVATGITLLLAGGFQLTPWKAHQLACCRESGDREGSRAPDALRAWRHGLRMGARCMLCCAGFMTVLLVTDVMSLGAMALVTAGITAERLLPRPGLLTRTFGIAIVASGAFVILRALRPS